MSAVVSIALPTIPIERLPDGEEHGIDARGADRSSVGSWQPSTGSVHGRGPILQAVPQRRSRGRVAFAVIPIIAIIAVVIVQMLLSIAVTQGAYDVDGYQIRLAQLALQKQKLADDVDRLQSPQYLAANVEALGMVPNTNPVYLRLSDGQVLGTPTAARAAPVTSTGLVANSLLTGVPLAAQPKVAENPGIAAPAPAPAPPSVQGIPVPVTH
ncbi:MAG: hypothetical protein B5766_10585 [Candidatus Lumbricidophila eiseniae]|uniref:Cell division protein FtsL n=1 Tax=Candidatus Lumbricidiphila eiseniae TaxID=1969409 RepID=A0A2A6FPK8_9MICO|nr:MAG: hypothetical protein B5766_10585 [Candidatus Lumbricidophila eiseniae]